jgi:hypothetical protein
MCKKGFGDSNKYLICNPTGILTRARQLLLFVSGIDVTIDGTEDHTYTCKSCFKELEAIETQNRALLKAKSLFN